MDLYIQIIVVACLTGMTSLLAHRSAAVFHDGQAVAQGKHIGQVVRDQENAHAIGFQLVPQRPHHGGFLRA